MTTVAELRALLADMPDDYPVLVSHTNRHSGVTIAEDLRPVEVWLSDHGDTVWIECNVEGTRYYP